MKRTTPRQIIGEQQWAEISRANKERYNKSEEALLIDLLCKAGADLQDTITANRSGGMSIIFSLPGHIGAADIRIGINDETGDIVPDSFEFNYPNQTIPIEQGPETRITPVGRVKGLIPIGWHKEGVPL